MAQAQPLKVGLALLPNDTQALVPASTVRCEHICLHCYQPNICGHHALTKDQSHLADIMVFNRSLSHSVAFVLKVINLLHSNFQLGASMTLGNKADLGSFINKDSTIDAVFSEQGWISVFIILLRHLGVGEVRFSKHLKGSEEASYSIDLSSHSQPVVCPQYTVAWVHSYVRTTF